MLAVQLPKAIEDRLESLAVRTGRSKSFYVQEAVLEHLDDLESACPVERGPEEIRSGRSRAISPEELSLRESAALYAEIYEEDDDLRALTESALGDWPA